MTDATPPLNFVLLVTVHHLVPLEDANGGLIGNTIKKEELRVTAINYPPGFVRFNLTPARPLAFIDLPADRVLRIEGTVSEIVQVH